MNIDKEPLESHPVKSNNEIFSVASIRKEVREMKLKTSEDTMFITFTLKPKFYQFKASTQRELTQNEICTKLREATSDFVITTELTKHGNIHYHAIAEFKSHGHFLKWNDSMKGRKAIGFHRVTPNPITHHDNMIRSKEYLIKDLENTIKLIDKNMILRQRDDYKFN